MEKRERREREREACTANASASQPASTCLLHPLRNLHFPISSYHPQEYHSLEAALVKTFIFPIHRVSDLLWSPFPLCLYDRSGRALIVTAALPLPSNSSSNHLSYLLT